jgi:hypothetical protein
MQVSEQSTLAFANLQPGEGRVYQLVAAAPSVQADVPAAAPAFSGSTKRLKALWA